MKKTDNRMVLKFLLLSFSLFLARVNSSVPELGLKFDGISARKLWKSNLEVRNKITDKGTLVSIRCIDFNIIKTLTQCQNSKEFSFGSRDF